MKIKNINCNFLLINLASFYKFHKNCLNYYYFIQGIHQFHFHNNGQFNFIILNTKASLKFLLSKRNSFSNYMLFYFFVHVKEIQISVCLQEK